jgi:hypothetical protein
MRKTIREIFSGANGKLSAKRVIGGIAMAIALGCTIYLVIRDGSNSVVENLLMTIFITSVSLLGLPAVTGMWGSSKISVSKSEEVDTAEPAAPETPPIEIPNCETCEFKKKYDRYNKKGTE